MTALFRTIFMNGDATHLSANITGLAATLHFREEYPLNVAYFIFIFALLFAVTTALFALHIHLNRMRAAGFFGALALLQGAALGYASVHSIVFLMVLYPVPVRLFMGLIGTLCVLKTLLALKNPKKTESTLTPKPLQQ